MSDKKQTTNVQTVDVDLSEVLGTGVDTVMVPNEPAAGDKKPGIFTRPGVDTSFLDNPGKPGDNEPPADPPADPADPPADPPQDPPADPADPQDPPADPPADPADPPADPLAQPGEPPADPVDDDKDKGGRPTVMVGALKKMFDDKILFPFDDGKDLKDYTQADIEELIQSNIEHQRTQLQEQLPEQFFGNMPPEMQQAWSYIANGGNDLKGLFQAMASSQEIREVDVSTEAGQAYAVRSYLQATNYGTQAEIEDEIRSLQDRGDLEKKAKQFKPKLDAMSQDMVNQRLAAQEHEKRQREAQSQQYMNSVYSALEGGELNGLKLDSRVQNMLYAGLVQPNYPSVSGKQTNQLGHLLEKYQWVEPNHGLIAEALWLLSDPDGYRQEIKNQGGQAQVQDTVRKLKTEQQSNRSGGAHQPEDDNSGGGAQRKTTIPRPKKGFFSPPGK